MGEPYPTPFSPNRQLFSFLPAGWALDLPETSLPEKVQLAGPAGGLKEDGAHLDEDWNEQRGQQGERVPWELNPELRELKMVQRKKGKTRHLGWHAQEPSEASENLEMSHPLSPSPSRIHFNQFLISVNLQFLKTLG